MDKQKWYKQDSFQSSILTELLNRQCIVGVGNGYSDSSSSFLPFL